MHPWCGRCVFIDTVIDKNTQVYFRCHVDETLDQAAGKYLIGCSIHSGARVRRGNADRRMAGASHLKVLSAGASNNDQIVTNPRRSRLELFRPSIQIPPWTAMPSDLQQKTTPNLFNVFKTLDHTGCESTVVDC